MRDFPIWKSVLTLCLFVIALYVVGADFYKKSKDSDNSGGLKLGLDLQGGAYLVLEADNNVFLKDYRKTAYELVRSRLISSGVSYSNISEQDNTIRFTLSNKEDYSKIQQEILNANNLLIIKLTNQDVIVEITSILYEKQLSSIIENSIEIIRKRIDQTGVNEPTIKRQGDNQIVVELPGVDDPERIKRILGTTAVLTFHKVDSESTFSGRNLPIGFKYISSKDGYTKNYAVKIEPDLYGKNLVNAKLEFQDNNPVVAFTFDTDGGSKFARLTSEYKGKMLAIVMDNKVISAPMVNSPITGGSGIITGNFTVDEAQELALLLRAGSLPVPLKVVEERIVGPTLGQESINSGLYAGLLGYLVVFGFMIFFYKKLGLIANVALMMNVIFVLSGLSLLGATLTLPGIAGIILTVGMAVDSNILVYERFAFEMNQGNKSYNLAMSNAFQRVFVTILDSNLTTLFTALFLFGFGSGPIRGFAITLIIGILSSMFGIVFVTRCLISLLLIKNNQRAKRRRA